MNRIRITDSDGNVIWINPDDIAVFGQYEPGVIRLGLVMGGSHAADIFIDGWEEEFPVRLLHSLAARLTFPTTKGSVLTLYELAPYEV